MIYFYSFVEWILNPTVFSFLVIVSCAAALLRPDIKTLAVFFWAAAYFSTQVPLALGWEIEQHNKLMLQCVVSLVLLGFYCTIPITRYIYFAMWCETALIALGFITVISNLHDWWHWMLVGIINWAGFASVCLNRWGSHSERRARVDNSEASHLDLDHVYSRAKANFRKKA